MTVVIGPYRFSPTDVRTTLVHALDLLDLYRAAASPVQSARRGRIAAALDGVDPLRDEVVSLVPVLEAVWPELLGARDDLTAASLLPPTSEGRVAGLFLGAGGVPKSPVDRVDVDATGVVGDRQAARRHHGRPWQALCLWSREVVEALAADGHPIAPGAAGENVTIAGLDWADVRPGVRLRLGEVLCEVSAFAVPCRKNAQWFGDLRFDRIHHSKGPISRVYATVLEPGAITVGDLAVVEPV